MIVRLDRRFGIANVSTRLGSYLLATGVRRVLTSLLDGRDEREGGGILETEKLSTHLPQVGPIVALALAGYNAHCPSRTRALANGGVVHASRVLMWVRRWFAGGNLETSSGFGLANVNRLSVGQSRVFVRVEIH